MKSQIEEKKSALCSPQTVADYLDSELNPQAESDFEIHLAACDACREELDLQKKFLSALEEEFDELPELPEDFTKKIVARAESNVEGLRRRDERGRAIFICAALFLVVIIGLGNETRTIFSAFGAFFGQAFAVGGFLAHFIFDFTIGLTVILKFLSHQFSPEAFFAFVFFAAFAVLGLLFLSRVKLVFGRS